MNPILCVVLASFPLLPALSSPSMTSVVDLAPRDDDDDDDDDAVQLAAAEVFIEFNSTDTDFGIQFTWDGVPWDRMKVEGPDGRTVLNVRVRRNLARQALTQGQFESAEPPASDLPMDALLARFPPGPYEFEGRLQSGGELEGETEFTHDIPAPPANLTPGDEARIDSRQPLVLRFDAVTTDLAGRPMVPELYQVFLETEDQILRVFSVVLDGAEPNPSVTVPPQFLRAGGEYKFEVIVQEDSGNRTITEVAFTTF